MKKKRRLLGAAWFGTEAAHGFFSAGEALTWDIKYQGFIELFRWGNKTAIGLSLAHELYANPFNEIYFNPPSIFSMILAVPFPNLPLFYFWASEEAVTISFNVR